MVWLIKCNNTFLLSFSSNHLFLKVKSQFCKFQSFFVKIKKELREMTVTKRIWKEHFSHSVYFILFYCLLFGGIPVISLVKFNFFSLQWIFIFSWNRECQGNNSQVKLFWVTLIDMWLPNKISRLRTWCQPFESSGTNRF